MTNTKNDELIFSLLLDGARGSSPYTWNEIKEWSSEKGTLWLHQSLPEDLEDNWLKNESGISETFVNILLNKKDRPRALIEKDKIFLSLRAINLNTGSNPEDMVFLHIYMDKNRIITIRHKKIMAIDEIKQSLENKCGPRGSNDFIQELLTKISHKIGVVIEKMDDQMDEVEEKLREKTDIKLRSSLSPLRRQIINLRRFLLPQKDVFNQLENLELSWLKFEEKNKVRELNEKYIRYLDDINLANERADIVHEEISSIYSEQLNQTMYILSIVTAIFLPLSFFIGLLGINVAGIPGEKYPLAFLIVCTILIIVVIIEIIIFKLKKWI